MLTLTLDLPGGHSRERLLSVDITNIGRSPTLYSINGESDDHYDYLVEAVDAVGRRVAHVRSFPRHLGATELASRALIAINNEVRYER